VFLERGPLQPNAGRSHRAEQPDLTLTPRRAGRHTIVFLERGPLYLVAAAATGEPAGALAAQLGLLHDHLVAILTDGFDRTLARNPRFEPRRLLGAAAPGRGRRARVTRQDSGRAAGRGLQLVCKTRTACRACTWWPG